MDQSSDVVIIGGGVIGCFIAYELSKAGLKVTVIEKGHTGKEASSASAGLLVPLIRWIEEGKRMPIFDLCWKSLKMFSEVVPSLQEETGISLEYVQSGVLRVAHNEDELSLLRAEYESWRADTDLKGCVAWFDAQRLHEFEKELAPDICGGALCSEEANINGVRLVDALAAAASQRGAKFIEGCMATGIRQSQRRLEGVTTTQGDIATRYIVISAGAWSKGCGEWFGVDLPISPVKGQMLSVRYPERLLSHPVLSHKGAVIPKSDGSIHAGATVEQVGFDKSNTPEGLAFLLEAISSLLPRLAKGKIERLWSGLRPWCEDGLPVIGPIPDWNGVIFATGHYKMGITCSPITAKLVKELIVEKRSEEWTKPFWPDRFFNGLSSLNLKDG